MYVYRPIGWYLKYYSIHNLYYLLWPFLDFEVSPTVELELNSATRSIRESRSIPVEDECPPCKFKYSDNYNYSLFFRYMNK